MNISPKLNTTDLKKKILVVGPYPPPYGGWAHVVSSIIDSPITDEYDIELYDTTLHTNIEQHNLLNSIMKAAYQLRHFPLILSRYQPDIVLICLGKGKSFWRDLIFIHLCRQRNVHVVLRFFGGQIVDWLQTLSFPLRSFVYRTIKPVKAALVETNSMVEKWQQIYSHIPVYLVPNFVNLETLPFNKNIPRDITRAVYLGTMTPAKGVEIILGAVDGICKYHPIEFHFIGNESTEGYLNQFVKKVNDLEYSEFVNVHGYMNKQNAHELISTCQLFLFPTTWMGEGQPAALIESMAMGVVPIVTRWRGITTIVTDKENGLLIDKPDSALLEQQIHCLLEDNNLFRELSKEARKTIVESYSSKAAIKIYKKVFETID